MPKLNGTGPRGLGAGTGRGFGLCCPRSGRTLNTGYGFKGYAKQDEKSIIEEDIKILKEELKAAEEELKSLKDQK
ncbi:MAG: DUF5320 domain-containing protein [bacterium]|nr:DUF5320 domain-containing protein [Candidatus Portnoybacteria bacterium]